MIFGAECVLDDWTIDWTANPWAVFRPGGSWPLCWTAEGITEMPPAELITPLTTASVALVYHWHEEHHDLLLGLVADYEVDTFPRSHLTRGSEPGGHR